MSSRERWTIYPLLILAVGMGIKTRVGGIENVPSIGCQTLTINDKEGRPLVRLHANEAGQGQIEFYNADGKLLLAAGGAQKGKEGQIVLVNSDGKPQVEIGSDGRAGLLQTCGPDGLPQMVLRSSSRGGNVLAWRGDHKSLLLLGHDDAGSGVFSVDSATGVRATIPFVVLPQQGHPPDAVPHEGTGAETETPTPTAEGPKDDLNPTPVEPDTPAKTEAEPETQAEPEAKAEPASP